ncbi:MAG TPA: hypothetical protein DDW52_16010 [Planctomycetaceae bacterium]|nr:hypothetical protein [Planctomycetaceae bacterium]
MVKSLVRYFGWAFGAVAFAMYGLLFIVAVGVMTGRWEEFLFYYENLFSAERAPAILCAWCGLKLIHELFHAGVCRRYGGEVSEAGLAFILFMPLAYVNVTSSWRFSSRWKRLHVTLAGIVAEASVAAAALLIWNISEIATIRQIASDVFLTATVSSLLFNLNPLLRFDGYFALADLTGVDNLYALGKRYSCYIGSRYILGLDVFPPVLPTARPGWIKMYGIAAAIYRTLTVAGLVIGAAAMFEGAGVLIAAGGLFAFVILPLAQLVMRLYRVWQAGQLSVTRLAFRLLSIAGFLTVLLISLPVTISRTVPAIVQYDPPGILRAQSAGFVDRILVQNGEFVVAEQPILVLRNSDLVLARDRKRTELAQTEQAMLKARWLGDSAETKQLESTARALAEQLTELERDVNQLTIVAPQPGRVSARRISDLCGTYLKAGTEIGVIGVEDQKRLKVSLSQRDIAGLEDVEHPIRVRVIGGSETWDASVQRIETRASTTPADPALLAINGGTLPSLSAAAETPELAAPRVNALVRLDPAHARQLPCGKRVSVALGIAPPSLAEAAIDGLREYLAW